VQRKGGKFVKNKKENSEKKSICLYLARMGDENERQRF
jgi:hypothetical protein